MRGVFVTGTDTGIGKTLVSAWLVAGWRAAYWKPIQTGALADDDSATVARLAPGHKIHPPAWRLLAPLSPHAAARREGLRIALSTLNAPETDTALVVEGAGGVLVPIGDDTLMIDLIARLGLPALVVARSGLGTVNHTLLTLEALRRRGLPIAGVAMNGPRDPENRAAIEERGRVTVLAEIEPLPTADAAHLARLPPPAFPPPLRPAEQDVCP
jgi:dethiobiotin synthetase